MQNSFSFIPVNVKSRAGRMAVTAVASALIMVSFVRPTQTAVANGETRSLSLKHVHTGESISITYKRNGSYDTAALQKLDWFLRDWRRDESTKMDPRLFDTIWLAYRTVGASQPINVIGGYRSPETNGMLRRRSRGVAKFSQHTLGKAMDFFIPGVPLSRLRVAGIKLQRGGVGFYPTSGSPFVHMDAGGVRMWPRMSRSELVSVFPDGKTVFIPADGRPLPGYAIAKAEIMRGGSRVGSIQAGGDDDGGDSNSGGGFFAVLFGGGRARTPAPEAPVQVGRNNSVAKPVRVQLPPEPPAMMAMAEPQNVSIPLPSRRPAGLGVSQTDAPADNGPRMIWQAGPDGTRQQMADLNVPMPPSRPDGQSNISSASPKPVVSDSGSALPAIVAEPPVRPTVEPKRAVFADLSAGSEGFMKRPAEPVSNSDVSALVDPVRPKPTARPKRSSNPQLVATRFEKMNFVSISSKVSSARDKTQAGLVRPDLGQTASLIAAPSKALVVKFGVVAYQDLRAETFSGAAVKPLRTASFAAMPDFFTGSVASN